MTSSNVGALQAHTSTEMLQSRTLTVLIALIFNVAWINAAMKRPCKFMDKIEYGHLGQEVVLPGGIDAYVSHPQNATSKGGVIVIQDIHGWTVTNTRAIVDMLMENNFTTILPDSFEGKPAWNRSSSWRDFFGFIRQRPANDLDNVVNASMKYLRDELSIENIAMVGFCWGGGAVHHIMAYRKDISAGVACYGLMDENDPKFGELNGPTLFIFGGADMLYPTKRIVKLRGTLRKKSAAKFAIRKYPKQPHGFVHRKHASSDDPNKERIYKARKMMIHWLNRFISK